MTGKYRYFSFRLHLFLFKTLINLIMHIAVTSVSKACLSLTVLALSIATLRGAPTFAFKGDLPVYSPRASGHQDFKFGHPLNGPRLDAIFKVLKFPTMSAMIDRLDSLNAYNTRQTTEQKTAGAYIAYSTAAKFKLLPLTLFKTEMDAMRAFGSLKLAGLRKDGVEVQNLLLKYGGNTGNLSPNELAYLWGSNEHQNLHAVLFGKEAIYDPVHATSMNDREEQPNLYTPNTLGGYNDKGESPQWGWFDFAKTYNSKLLS